MAVLNSQRKSCTWWSSYLVILRPLGLLYRHQKNLVRSIGFNRTMESTNTKGMFVGVQMTLVGLFLRELFGNDPLLTVLSILLVVGGVSVTLLS